MDHINTNMVLLFIHVYYDIHQLPDKGLIFASPVFKVPPPPFLHPGWHMCKKTLKQQD